MENQSSHVNQALKLLLAEKRRVESSPKWLFLDIDGCIVDYSRAILTHLGKSDQISNIKEYNDLIKIVGGKQALLKIQDEGKYLLDPPLLCYGIPSYLAMKSWANERGYRVAFLTSVVHHCREIWANKFDKSTPIFCGNTKYLLANSRSILVDDSEAQCMDFEANGGKTVMFPAPYNTLVMPDSIPLYLVDQLNKHHENINA